MLWLSTSANVAKIIKLKSGWIEIYTLLFTTNLQINKQHTTSFCDRKTSPKFRKNMVHNSISINNAISRTKDNIKYYLWPTRNRQFWKFWLISIILLNLLLLNIISIEKILAFLRIIFYKLTLERILCWQKHVS